MGNSCPGSRNSQIESAAQMYAEADRIERTGKYSNVRDTKQENVQTRGGTHGGFYSTFNAQEADSISLAVLIEHYQPYEFPICPVLNSDTQRLVRDSWSKIISMDFENTEFGTGKSFCISIRVEELELTKMKLKHLGQMHKSIIHHPYLFGIYASNIHSTIRHCLGDLATVEVMSAWLHLLAFILRGMLPSYFAGLNFAGHYQGAVNASSTINDKAREEVKATEDLRVLKTRLQSLGNTEPPSRHGRPRDREEPFSGELTGRSMIIPEGRTLNGFDGFADRPPPAHPMVEHIKNSRSVHIAAPGSPQSTTIQSQHGSLGKASECTLPGSAFKSKTDE